MTKNNQNNDTLNEIKKSPMFNMSLCSREDFFSAFIVWFLNIDIKNNIKIWGEDFECSEDARAIREYQSGGHCRYDIAIINKNNKITHIIENKVKCIVQSEQLKKYNEQADIKEAEKILLTFMSEKREFDGWKKITYKELYSNYKKLNTNFKTQFSDYNLKLCDDFFSQINNLYQLGEEIDLNSIQENFKVAKKECCLTKHIWQLLLSAKLNEQCSDITSNLTDVGFNATTNVSSEKVNLIFKDIRQDNKNLVSLRIEFSFDGSILFVHEIDKDADDKENKLTCNKKYQHKGNGKKDSWIYYKPKNDDIAIEIKIAEVLKDIKEINDVTLNNLK